MAFHLQSPLNSCLFFSLVELYTYSNIAGLFPLLLYARVLFFCEVNNNNKNAKEYLCLGLLR